MKALQPGSVSLPDTLARVAFGRAAPSGERARLSIAIFHRVLPAPDPLFPDEVDRDRFDAICGWLSAWFNVLPLDQAAERLQRGDLPSRALAITFDDGYADNHDIALPVLRSHGLGASFFIATGFLDGGRMWNDTVVESIRRCTLDSIDLTPVGLPGIGHIALGSIGARRAAIAQLLPAIKYRPAEQRLALVEQIAAASGATLPDDLMMTSQQVRAMADAGMQIGAHTVNHPILAKLDAAQARSEMLQSRSHLQDLLGQPVTLFAYPNGKPGSDYLPRDVALAREVGFTAAVSTSPGAARYGQDLFELQRFTPWDRGRWAFGARLLRNLF